MLQMSKTLNSGEIVREKMGHPGSRNLLVEKRDTLARITFNRPAVLNALNKELLLDLQRELEIIRDDPEIQAVVLTGAGSRAFSAGADISFLARAQPLQVRELAQLAVAVAHLLENLNKITIALINGFALGGGLEIAEACMFRIAVRSAKLGHPEVRIGAVAGWGGTTRLPRLIGRSRATEMLLTGKVVDAEEAHKIGLVHRLVEPEELKAEGNKLLGELLQNSPVAVNLTWQAMHRGLELPLAESAKLGADYFGLAATTMDFREGTKAFLNKEKPEFSCG